MGGAFATSKRGRAGIFSRGISCSGIREGGLSLLFPRCGTTSGVVDVRKDEMSGPTRSFVVYVGTTASSCL